MTTGGKVRRRIISLGKYLCVLLIIVWTVAPMAWLFISSISPYRHIISERVGNWFPAEPTMENYASLFDPQKQAGERFLYALRNSAIIATSVTLACLVLGTLAAYALARLDVRGKNTLVMSLMAIRMLPTISLVIPFFVLISRLDYFLLGRGVSFHLFDTKLNLIILYTTFILGFVIWIMRGFFLTIPKGLEEAARVDGCTRLQALRRIVLPLSAPGLVATGIFSFLLAWDEFLLALVFSRSNASITLPLFIAELGSQYITAHNQISAVGFLASLPPVILALLFQKFIIKGLMAGSVKG